MCAVLESKGKTRSNKHFCLTINFWINILLFITCVVFFSLFHPQYPHLWYAWAFSFPSHRAFLALFVVSFLSFSLLLFVSFYLPPCIAISSQNYWARHSEKNREGKSYSHCSSLSLSLLQFFHTFFITPTQCISLTLAHRNVVAPRPHFHSHCKLFIWMQTMHSSAIRLSIQLTIWWIVTNSARNWRIRYRTGHF